MKLKVPIEKKEFGIFDLNYHVTPGNTREKECFNACLDEVNQCEVCFDEEKLAKLIIDRFEVDGNRIAKVIIAAMPEIMTVKKVI
jgi:hypothetical protein